MCAVNIKKPEKVCVCVCVGGGGLSHNNQIISYFNRAISGGKRDQVLTNQKIKTVNVFDRMFLKHLIRNTSKTL